MEILDWFFIGLLSVAILCLFFTVVFFVLNLNARKKIRALKKKRPKKKSKRKKWLRVYKQQERSKKRYVKWMVALFIFGFLAGGSAFYSRYYQATNLNADDSKALVQGYLLVDEINKNLEQVPTTKNPEQLKNTIYELTSRLSSYGARQANGRLEEEGRLKLNRLYKNMKELGINLSNLPVEVLKNETTYEGYLADVKKVQENQKEVFRHFHIDEAALKAQK